MIWKELRRAGILGMNRRNYDYVQRWNPRRSYPLVDDKVRTKTICEREGIPVPELYGRIPYHYDLPSLRSLTAEREAFVLKPAHGSQGNGVLVVRGRDGERFVRANGRQLEFDDLVFHASEVLSGLYSLGGQPDQLMVEECLDLHPAFHEVAAGGIPDVRLVVYRGYPVMAMLRLPTRLSDGRANLHQGAIGAGIDLITGRTSFAAMRGRYVERHPDTDARVVDFVIPGFEQVLQIGVRAAQAVDLGYLGVDLVVDERRGPVLLELNARPGLSIQIANGAGLVSRLERIDRVYRRGADEQERILTALRVAAESERVDRERAAS